MSASTAHASPIEEVIDGEIVRFARINCRGYGVYEDAVRANKVAAAEQAARNQGDKMPAAEKAGFVYQSSQSITDGDVAKYLATHKGALSACRDSLIRAGRTAADADAILDKTDFPTARDIALQVVGLISFAAQPSVAEAKSRDWDTEVLLIREYCKNIGDPGELTIQQFDQALEIAKMRKQQAAQQPAAPQV